MARILWDLIKQRRRNLKGVAERAKTATPVRLLDCENRDIREAVAGGECVSGYMCDAVADIGTTQLVSGLKTGASAEELGPIVQS